MPTLMTLSDSQTRPRLRGRMLATARLTWAVIALVAVTLSIAGQPALYREFRTLARYDVETRETVWSNLAQLGISLEIYAAYFVGLGLLLTLTCFAMAAIIFFRRSNQPMALFVALLLVLLGATFSGAINASAHGGGTLAWLHSVLTALSYQSIFLLFYLFPDGRFVPRWTRWLAIVSFLCVVPPSFVPGWSLNLQNWPGVTYAIFVSAMLITGIGAQIYRYRRISGYWERQQTRWVVLGFAVALGGYIGVGLLPAFVPSLQPGTLEQLAAAGAMIAFMLLIPLSFGIAILRYHLWDIDVVINKTLVYGVLTGLLITIYFTGVVLLQSLFRAITGQSSELAIIISTLAVAALVQPARKWIQTAVDRRFYRRKYDAARTVSTFASRLRNEIDLATLSSELEVVVADTMEPEHVSLWLRGGENRRPKSL